VDHQTQFRLARLLGMLGSDHDGEVVAAARAIKRLLESKGLSFADLVEQVAEPSLLPARRHGMEGVAGMCRAILINENMLREHELQFVRDMLARASSYRFKPTEKQSNWLTFLFARYGEDCS
jgi:hypothetical protein